MSDERGLGRLEARVERLEGLRRRLTGLLPLTAGLALLAGLYTAGRLDGFDDRLDRLEQRADRVERQLVELLARLPGPRP